MLLSEEIALPCGLRLPNRLSKAAMAESMAPTATPNEKLLKAYGEWADGGWGMVLTGNVQVSDTYLGSPGDVAILSEGSPHHSESVQGKWKEWANICQRSGTPTIVQLCHPGRQSLPGAGNRGFFDKTIAPSAVKMRLGPGLLNAFFGWFLFGTPREMTVEDISVVIDQFAAAARQSYEAGFKGVEIHGAHGYLLTQFLSPKTNLRVDEFGGTPQKRAEIVLRVIRAIREATSKEFCIGIKLNSVDAGSSDSLPDVMEQIQLIVDAGIDFIEISGGSYENPTMGQVSHAEKDASPAVAPKQIKESTLKRESLFLDFAKTVRERFPSVVLMVTGGFRTRVGMEEAIQAGGCDLIGIGRPAAVLPRLPKEIILNTAEVPDEKANVLLTPVKMHFLLRFIPIKQVGAGASSFYYSSQIQRMGAGLVPLDTRVSAIQ